MKRLHTITGAADVAPPAGLALSRRDAPNANWSTQQALRAANQLFHYPQAQECDMAINVRDFGAFGNGINDDRPAIQSALNAAASVGGNVVFFPPGIYIVSEEVGNPWSIDLPGNGITLFGVRGNSWLKHPVKVSPTINSAVALLHIDQKDAVTIRGMGFDGNWGNVVTKVTAVSNGQTISSTPATINVLSTAGFPKPPATLVAVTTAGALSVAYTGITSNTFTGCTSSGTGTLVAGYNIGYIDGNPNPGGGINQSYQCDPRNYLVQLAGTTRVTIENCLFRQAYGDFVWVGGSRFDNTKWAQDIRLLNCDGDMSARNGFTIGGGAAIGVHVFGCKLANILAQAVDTEPDRYPVRDIIIESNYLDTWWQPSGKANSPLSISGGAGGGITTAAAARNFRVRNNTINGTTFILYASDVVFEGNRVIQDWDAGGDAGVALRNTCDDVRICNNYFYSRVLTQGLDGGLGCAAIVIENIANPTAGLLTPAGIRVAGNNIHVRNGRHGIAVTAAGGQILNDIGTATSIDAATAIAPGSAGLNLNGQTVIHVDSTSGFPSAGTIYVATTNGRIQPVPYTGITLNAFMGCNTFGLSGTMALGGNVNAWCLIDTSKSWPTNQWSGLQVKIGRAIAAIASNTESALLLFPANNSVDGVTGTAWVTDVGEYALPPNPGAYTITRITSLIDVSGNCIDLKDDGNGNGRYGIYTSFTERALLGMRVQIKDNFITADSGQIDT
jgi:hypothetical protein